MSELIRIITSPDPEIRNRSLETFCREASLSLLLEECMRLDRFRRVEGNLFEQIRALFFLHAIHRYYMPRHYGVDSIGSIPFDGYLHLLKRHFEDALDIFLAYQAEIGPNDAISSALAATYHHLGFQTLADQVRRSMRSVQGNQWLFRIGHPADHPLRIHSELFNTSESRYPILRESTPLRLDLSHAGWSDVYFLGMDYPEGARVLNVSVNLTVNSQGDIQKPHPPIHTFFRIIDRPVLRLISTDLGIGSDITSLAEVFDFKRDHLGVLKAAVVASGIIPPGMEGAEQPLGDVLARVVEPDHGIEIVSRVDGIPDGANLDVSTSLLASLIAVCMRATRQTFSLTGGLNDETLRIISARVILGEWLTGSSNGRQDTGGIWPGITLNRGVQAVSGDPEYGISNGRLLASHQILRTVDIPQVSRRKLKESLVLVHGGMAQDVAPFLEIVTEKYLLRTDVEWEGRQRAISLLDDVMSHLAQGNILAFGIDTHNSFTGPTQVIVPWASNLYVEKLITHIKAEFGEHFWGFVMLGGMAGGGMGFLFDPEKKQSAKARLQILMNAAKRSLDNALPFALEPIVYEFDINENGSHADFLEGTAALMPPDYYSQIIARILRGKPDPLSRPEQAELDLLDEIDHTKAQISAVASVGFDGLPTPVIRDTVQEGVLDRLLAGNGFNPVKHEQIRSDLRNGNIGLANNRLPLNSQIEDARPNDVVNAGHDFRSDYADIGYDALAQGLVAVVSMAGGVGSRWTNGAGVVKALNPFCKFSGKHRAFIEIHLAKSRRMSRLSGRDLPHIITTSYMTHEPIRASLMRENQFGYKGPLFLSPGRSVGLRLIPMVRDLRYIWQEMPRQLLDQQAQKGRESLQNARIEWVQQMGEGNDYTDNEPALCLHPLGHWYEVPNLFVNGILLQLLEERPQLRYLMVHNIDTLGADVNPALLGYHIECGTGITTEVITRRLEDRGGGLARINGRLRLIEGLALPRENIEFRLSYYNTSTTWIDIDRLLRAFDLARSDLTDDRRVAAAVHSLAEKMPTYIAIKDVKRRWGNGQEDVYPVTQFEKLWGDMTSLPDLEHRFVAVSRMRGQQLKEPAQLDGWLRDGSAAYLASICDWV